MGPYTGRGRFNRLGVYGAYIAVLIVAAAVLLIQRHLFLETFPQNTVLSASAYPPPKIPDPTGWQKLGIQADSDRTNLLTTLATGLLGGLGLLLFNRGSERPKPRYLWSAILSALGAGVSLFFGFVAHTFLAAMLDAEYFDAHGSGRPIVVQFGALMGGAFFLAYFAFHDLTEEN
jgi:hypothetical protein